MRFIHITDPHLSSLSGQSFFALSAKRRSGYVSWTRRRQKIHLRDVLQGLLESVRAESADQLIVSGDLVQIGLEEEIREAGAWLKELAAPEQIFFVPGNHDVYARDSWSAVRRHWNFVLPEPRPGTSDSPTAGYPLVRDFGKIRLIGASSACVTPIFSARGALGQQQIGRLSNLMRESREHGFLVCLAVHHPPLPGMAQWRKALKEVRRLRELISLHQPALAWCGHLHHNRHVREGDSNIYCTASASSLLNASYRVFDIEETDGTVPVNWNIRMQLKSLTRPERKFKLAADQRWNVRS